MISMFALVFNDRAEAEAALADVKQLQKGAVLALHDAVLVSRSSDGGVKLDQSINVAAIGAATGAFWGSLIGLIFLSPLMGAAVGAAAGGLGGYFSDYGIDDEFIKGMGQKLAPGRVALFVLASNVTPERVAQALGPRHGELFYSSFSPEVEQRFRQVVQGGETQGGGMQGGPTAQPGPSAGPAETSEAAATEPATRI